MEAFPCFFACNFRFERERREREIFLIYLAERNLKRRPTKSKRTNTNLHTCQISACFLHASSSILNLSSLLSSDGEFRIASPEDRQ